MGPRARLAALLGLRRGGEAAKAPTTLERAGSGTAKWLPHLYINTNDYICCCYTDAAAGTATVTAGGGGGRSSSKAGLARMVLVSKGPTKFLDAHGLQQWWADDVELQVALNHSKLIDRQLRSLYAPPPAARADVTCCSAAPVDKAFEQ